MDESAKFNKGQLDGVKNRGRPLGGAPEVAIPPLNADPIDGGGSMQDQAAALRDPTNPLSPSYDPQVVAQEQQSQMDPQALRAGHTGQQGAFDRILPPDAQKDPRFRQGIGSAYAANQPQLQQPLPAQPGNLSDETKGGLDAIARFQERAEQAQQEETAGTTEEQIRANDEELSKKFMKDNLGIENPEEFFTKYNEEMDQLQDPVLKKAIEARCATLDLVQLLEEGEARQDVPIVPGKFVVTFRTISGEEDLEIKRLLFGVQSSDQYAYDLLSMYQLAAGLFSINGRKIPTHLNDDRGFDKDKFISKFRLLRKYPMAMLASMSVNFGWFDRRTRALFVDVEGLKNG